MLFRSDQLLNNADQIAVDYQSYLDLQQQLELLDRKFDTDRQAQSERQKLQQQLDRQTQELQLSLGKSQAELALTIKQEQELVEILATASDVSKGIAELNICRQRLTELDRLQVQVLPIQKEQIALMGQIDLVLSIFDDRYLIQLCLYSHH